MYKRLVAFFELNYFSLIEKFRFISKFDFFSSFKHDINSYLCCCWCYLFSDHDQCSHMVHLLAAVSTNRLVISSTEHATASSIVLYHYYYYYYYYYCYYYYYISCICICYVYRPSSSKSTTSCQNFYPHQPTLSSETKTVAPNYRTSLFPRRHHSQSSVYLDDSSIVSNHSVRRDRILPQESASNRLKTLRSLLFRGHKTLGINPMIVNNRYHHNRDLDSTLSEYPIRSLSQSFVESQLPKSHYEEQEDCVELKSECSILTNQNRDLFNKAKSNQEPRQINSWDDI